MTFNNSRSRGRDFVVGIVFRVFSFTFVCYFRPLFVARWYISPGLINMGGGPAVYVNSDGSLDQYKGGSEVLLIILIGGRISWAKNVC